MERTALLLAAAFAFAFAGCTSETDNHPKPIAGKARGMSPGAEAQTSTGAR
jgi:hypothetical protein